MMKKITILLLALLLLTACSKKPATEDTPDVPDTTAGTQTQRPGSFGNDNTIDFDNFFEEETQPQESGRPSVPQGSQPNGSDEPTTGSEPEEDPQPSTGDTPVETPVETPTEKNDDPTENTDSTQETTATPPPPVIGSDGYYGSILRP